ncbi:restriction endonuclease subunit S [Noviherbaspirillum cavernae]|uniref:Restriction endonuclease subunit S n=1 Tax=Noviherbaspirillum cavernae TaxID=2320862 RepID=A0A418WWZ3_9BURK|nr:restriction endonuclease subunit S [Noviherbaspirillum cavernae]RJG04643.1 restriction endonuclease subunit S [Noviherbaspirillum cavernae]
MMNRKYRPYEEYKDLGVEWLNRIPKHWNLKKLKFQASVFPSNVDKKSKEGEIPVRLCNYTDVYYSERITSSIEFMSATATPEQIEKFSLKAGDTLITKDSEDPNDIAIPSYVPEDIEGVICGYHLAIVRPHIEGNGRYIKRVFESDYAKAYFSTRANGLTRYGLGTYALSNVFYPSPPVDEAQSITNFLDHETAKIDTLIEKQQQLIKLLKEKRQAVISHTVTKGLNRDVPMRNSGVEWLGEMPEHWKVSRIKNAASKIVDGPHFSPSYVDDGYMFISARNIKVDGWSLSDAKFICERDFLEFNKRIRPEKGDVLLTKGGTTGIARAVDLDFPFQVWVHVAVLKTIRTKVTPFFVAYALNGTACYEQSQLSTYGATNNDLGLSRIANIVFAMPPLEEQKEIHEYLDDECKKFDALIAKCLESINLMQERRTALISAAVTGKIDVRDWQAPSHTTHKKIAA